MHSSSHPVHTTPNLISLPLLTLNDAYQAALVQPFSTPPHYHPRTLIHHITTVNAALVVAAAIHAAAVISAVGPPMSAAVPLPM
jgi:hypothetical protein